MMGLFPSNFVSVLGEGFVPMRRSISPMPDLQKSDSTSRNSLSQIQEKKERAKSRRPFNGYKNAKTPKSNITAPSQQGLPAPASKPRISDPNNPPSTVLWQQRPPSRAPSRTPSPISHHEIGSSPPPPPPPHRTIGGRAASPAPQAFDMNDRYQSFSRTPSPVPPSDSGHTPPMIRNAMDDVISSLDDMTLVRHDSLQKEPEQELNPWSPDAFDEFRCPDGRPGPRPLTSLGLGAGGSTFSEARINYSSRHNSPDRFNDGAPRLENYVQRMESRLRRMQQARELQGSDPIGSDPPDPPPKNSTWASHPNPSMASRRPVMRKRKSAFELGGDGLGRALTQKTNSTNTSGSSSGAQSQASTFSRQTALTSQSIMSGYSAGAFSATSAGSLARKRMGSVRDCITRPMTSSGMRNEQWGQSDMRPKTPTLGVSFQTNHEPRQGAKSAIGWEDANKTPTGGLGGFTTPKAKKSGFFKKLIDSAKTGAASARSTISASQTGSNPGSPTKLIGIAGGTAFNAPIASSVGRDAAREMGLVGGAPADYILTRRDVNRSNTPGPSERQERADRCHMLDQPVICPVEELYENLQGDEDADGRPVYEPFQLSNPSFSQVDKAARFVTSFPSSITAASLATGFICRPYRSGVQRLRAIFIWCAERISWEEDHDFDTYHYNQPCDTRKVVQTKRGSSQEIAALVLEMCMAIGIHAEVVQGCLKTPGEDLNLNALSRPNHFWNAVLVDGEWRMLDASLASPTNPKRAVYSSVSTSIAESWYFLTRPSELCWTHIPVEDAQQHMLPNSSPDVLLTLPGTCPPFFRLGLSMHAYDTSIIRMDGLEVCTFSINVPNDVEVVVEVEARRYLHDEDGDVYEDADNITKKRALAQPSWYRTVPSTDISQKRYVVKAVLPGDERVATLKVFAGKKGLMLSSRDIVHPLAMALPLYHSGENPAYDFVMRHPTPHATRQDLYVVQPQCYRLGAGETYVFCVRQHAASVVSTPATEQNGFDLRPISPSALTRPASAMSMTSSATGSNPSEPSMNNPHAIAAAKLKDKPAKLAIQAPGGKIIRLNRKHEGLLQPAGLRDVDGEVMGSVWETVVKVGEKGVWRGLVLADRSARWCVWGEWECV